MMPPDELPERSAMAPDLEILAALERAGGVLGALSDDDRTAFVERFVDGMKLRDIADAHGVSLSTIKRTLSRAEKRFVMLSARDPVLHERLTSGARWQVQSP